MTKRLLALVLALLMPLTALAEASCFEVRVEMEADIARDVILSTGVFSGAEDEAALCDAFVELVDGIALRLVTQEDAGRFSIAFDETNLLDLGVLVHEENLVVTSDLLADRGLMIPSQQLNAQEDPFLRLVEETDWLLLLGGVMNAAAEQLDAFECSTQRGSFSGDAYSGGVYCTTWHFDDQDIAALLTAVMTQEAQAFVRQALPALGFDGEALLAEIQQAHARASEENAHRYILRLVMDEAHMPIGASVVVLKGVQQLGTFSFGLQEDEISIVVGFGMDDVNYWHCQGIHIQQTTDDSGMTSLRLDGAIEEFTAPKDEDFAFAFATNDKALYGCGWSAQLNMRGTDLTWSISSETTADGALPVAVMGKGFFLGGNRFSMTLEYSADGKAYMTERFTWMPCDAMDTSVDGLELFDLNSGDMALLGEIGMDLQMELTERLLKVIPIRLLLFLQ